MLGNGMLMAIVIAVGKIAMSLLSAVALIYFCFPFRNLAFWMVFVTLMLSPVAVVVLMQRWFVKGLVDADR